MVPAFIEVILRGQSEPTLIATDKILYIQGSSRDGCFLNLVGGYMLEVNNSYVELFETLQ